MKCITTCLILLFSCSIFCQKDSSRPLPRKVIIKTNLFNLIAAKPTITIEKFFLPTLSVEVSYVQGQFNNFLLTDHYEYKGFLVRAKKHFGKPDNGKINPFLGAYAGNLKRVIQTVGQTATYGLGFSYPSKDFAANSIRAGGTVGLAWFVKRRLALETLMSLGYGRYTRYYKPDQKAKGYADAQIWFSVGYCF